MKIILSIATSESPLDWNKGKLFQHVTRLLEGLRTMWPDQTMLCSDSGPLLERVAGLCSCRYVDCTLDTFEKRIQHLLKTLAFEDQETVCFIDGRNPFLDADGVKQFLDACANGTSPALSVSPVDPSPFYLLRLLTLAGAGSLHLFDTHYPNRDYYNLYPEGYGVTLPFAFRWDKHAPQAGPGEYYRTPLPDGLAWSRLYPGQEINGAVPDCLFIWEGPRQARAVIPAEKNLAGKALPQGEEPTRMPVVRSTREGWEFEFTTSLSGKGLEIMPFGTEGPWPSYRRVVQPEGTSWHLPLGQAPENTTGFLFHVTEPLEKGVPWAKRKFDASTLWNGGRSLATGERITGRQNIPKVLSSTGELAFGRVNDLTRLPLLLAEGKVHGVDHPCPSILVKTPEDLLRLRALQRALNEREENDGR